MTHKTWLFGAAVCVGLVTVLAVQARKLDQALGAFDAWGGVPTWGPAVGGLRARLIADRRRYPVGDPIILILEIQNVSGQAILLTAPHLMPSIDMPDEEHRRRQLQPIRLSDYNTFITAEPVGDGEFLHQQLLEVEEMVLRSPVRLQPNGVFTMIVRSGDVEMKDQLQRLAERIEATPQPRRTSATHWFEGQAGRYRLVVKVTLPPPGGERLRGDPRNVDAGRWRGTLTTPPIIVEIEEEADEDKS